MGDLNSLTGKSRGGGVAAAAAAAAPFVMKTYRMVEDPATDALIAWGSANNSFVVVDPFGFAQRLLPAHFKHGNFSSFVRQLNTYGFRKVDPDRWEFAHGSFLRGQAHLLRRIVRRGAGCRHGGGSHHSHEGKEADGGEGGEVDDAIAVEVARLKWEQRVVQEKVRSMWRRMEETERKPRQMMALLFKVVRNPHLLKQQPLEAAASSAASLDGGGCRCRPDAYTSKKGRGMLPGLQQEICLGLNPPEEEDLLGSGGLPLGAADMDAPALDHVGVFAGPSQFFPELVGGGGIVRMEDVAAAAAAAYPFALPTN